MYDRNVEFPNRYQLVKVEGTDDIYDLVPAPGRVDNDGTLINKNSLLKDATAALFGMGADAVPDDVLQKINENWQHAWKKRVYTPQSFVVETTENVFKTTGEQTLKYSSGLNVSEGGEISLAEPITSVTYNSNATVLQAAINKYFTIPNVIGTPQLLTEAKWNTSNMRFESRVITGVPASKSDTFDILISPDENAYPHNVVEDGFFYEYCGIPFNNAVSALNVETGRYVGTGTYGSSNPNSLTFGFEPKIVFIKQSGSDSGFMLPWSFGSVFEYCAYVTFYGNSVVTGGTTYGKKEGNTVSFYSTNNARQQFNATGLYYYTAIG